MVNFHTEEFKGNTLVSSQAFLYMLLDSFPTLEILRKKSSISNVLLKLLSSVHLQKASETNRTS